MEKLGVLVGARQDQDEANLVHSPSPGPARHLQQVGGTQVDKTPAVEAVALADHHRTGGIVHARGHGRGGKDGFQAARLHELFQKKLPVWQLPAVMSAHPGVFQDRQMLMPPQEGKTLQRLLQMLPKVFGTPRPVTFGGRMAEKNGPFAIRS